MGAVAQGDWWTGVRFGADDACGDALICLLIWAFGNNSGYCLELRNESLRN